MSIFMYIKHQTDQLTTGDSKKKTIASNDQFSIKLIYRISRGISNKIHNRYLLFSLKKQMFQKEVKAKEVKTGEIYFLIRHNFFLSTLKLSESH